MTRSQAIEIAARAVEQLGPRVAQSHDELVHLAGQSFYVLLSAWFHAASVENLVPGRWKGRDFWVISFALLGPPRYDNRVDPEGPVIFLDDQTLEIEMPLLL